jgi:signal transduction histidine kinase/CheY-like chemotaxis protein/membrane-bound lytic murein transglycosylase MltF
VKFILSYLASFIILVTSLISSELNLSKEEIEWIKNNPSVKFGADNEWPPFDFVDKNGNYAGLSSEYIKTIEQKSGLKIKVYPVVWSDALKSAKSKEYDGLTCAVETENRKKYLRFSDAYLNVPMVIISRSKNRDIKSIDDLKGRVVSVNKDSYVHEWLKSKHPKVKLHLTKSNEESMEVVSVGKADAYIGNLAVSTYIINKYMINNLNVMSKVQGFNTSIGMAVDKDNEILFSIIQKSLKSITTQEDQEIKSRWRKVFSLEEKSQVLKFSKKQQIWIDKHPTLRFVIDNYWEPIEYLSKKDGYHSGISSSYLEHFSKKTGIKFELIKTKTWSDSVNLINKREADLYTCVAKTDSREKVVNFSIPYLSMPQVFVTKHNVNYIEDIESLYGKKVVLVEGYYIVDLIKKEHPQIDILLVENISQALNAVTQNKAYAYIDILPIASNYIQKRGYSNLKISGVTTYKSKFSMALRNDWDAIGVEVINKVLNSISQEEKSDIYNKWIDVKYDKEIDYTIVWQIIGVFLFFISGTLYWNRKLSIEVTKRKLAQEELFELNKKLEEAKNIAVNANKAKSDFLSNMSHEIRTPMNAILGFAELLDKKIEDPKLNSFVKTIRSSGQTLLALINDILDLSKIESGKLVLVKSRVNIKKVCEETLSIFKLQAEQKGLELLLEVEGEMPKALLLDQVRLNEILINLIGNALKFTEEGYIKVVLQVNEVYDRSSKVDFTIRVEDSGIGIAKSDQNNIFNIFEQTHNQDISKYGGTGLGLAISRKLSKLMGGSLEVESELGKGSSFIIGLKSIDIASVSDVEHIKNIEQEEDNLEFEKSVVLVVDDVEENRNLVKESLLGSGVEILEAVNGEEAIEVFKCEEIDLILMDIRMPVMDGYTATKLIKASSSIPIIALTASIMQDELNKLEGGKFDGYLRKPVSKKALLKEVSKFLSFKSSSNSTSRTDKVSVDNIQSLISFVESVKENIEELYIEAIQTNDINKIENFASKLKEISSEYKINYIIKYSEELLEKVDSFDIDGISLMLEKYEIKIKDVKSKL